MNLCDRQMWDSLVDFLQHHKPLCRMMGSRGMWPNLSYTFIDGSNHNEITPQTLRRFQPAKDNSAVKIFTTQDYFVIKTKGDECVLKDWNDVLDYIENHGHYASSFDGVTNFVLEYVGEDKIVLSRTNQFGTQQQVTLNADEFLEANVFPSKGEGEILQIMTGERFNDGGYQLYDLERICFV